MENLIRPAWYGKAEEVVRKFYKANRIGVSIMIASMILLGVFMPILEHDNARISIGLIMFMLSLFLICMFSAILAGRVGKIHAYLKAYQNKEDKILELSKKAKECRAELSLPDDELKEVILSRACCYVGRFIKDIDMEKVRKHKISTLWDIENNMDKFKEELLSMKGPEGKWYLLCARLMRVE